VHFGNFEKRFLLSAARYLKDAHNLFSRRTDPVTLRLSNPVFVVINKMNAPFIPDRCQYQLIHTKSSAIFASVRNLKTHAMRIVSLMMLILLLASESLLGQSDHIKGLFPSGTIFHQNIAYAGDTLKKHLLDIYLPPNAKSKLPLVIWVHGGGWMHNDKYADMSYMGNTIKAIIDNGYALASIDYRQSTQAIFPAQILDCNQAVEFLYKNAAQYNIDKDRFILFGFSAGGHLASLQALSLNNNVQEFYPAKLKPSFKIKAVIDFYGPSDFLLFYATETPGKDDSPIGKLLGVSPLVRPDVSKKASPVSYVDKDDPPFFIVHGEKDDGVPTTQSYLLKGWLDVVKVKNELTIVKDAPHYGEMFDQKEIREKLITFLKHF
jgi:acetyl esterase/lipase